MKSKEIQRELATKTDRQLSSLLKALTILHTELPSVYAYCKLDLVAGTIIREEINRRTR